MERRELLHNAAASARRLASLREEQAALTRRLADSLALEAFAGRPIFDQGAVKTRVMGAGRDPDSSWRFELQLGNGEVIAWPLFDVPPRFWPSLAGKMRESLIGRQRLAKLEAKWKESEYV